MPNSLNGILNYKIPRFFRKPKQVKMEERMHSGQLPGCSIKANPGDQC